MDSHDRWTPEEVAQFEAISQEVARTLLSDEEFQARLVQQIVAQMTAPGREQVLMRHWGPALVEDLNKVLVPRIQGYVGAEVAKLYGPAVKKQIEDEVELWMVDEMRRMLRGIGRRLLQTLLVAPDPEG